MSSRIEHYRDSAAPAATHVVPVAYALVRDARGRLLMVRRADTGNWELPGGHIEPGESIVDALSREVEEESGDTIKVTRLAGVYSDPGHVFVYRTGDVRQQLAVYLHAEPVDDDPHADGVECIAAEWIEPQQLAEIPIHPALRTRLQQILEDPESPHIG